MGQETKPTTARLREIIAIAKEHGVSRVHVGDIELEFWPEKPERATPRPETAKERKAREEAAAKHKDRMKYLASGSVLAEIKDTDNG